MYVRSTIAKRVGLGLPRIPPFAREPEKAVASWNTTHAKIASTLASVGPMVSGLCINGDRNGGVGGGHYH